MTFISTFGQAMTQTERIKSIQSRLATLQNQLATGKKAQLFKGLDTDVLQSKRARANFKKLQNYGRNIDNADRRIKVMLNAIGEIKQQAGNIVNAIQIQTQEGEFEMETVGDLANKVRDFMVDLINQTDSGRYVFGGAVTRDKPLDDQGTLDTYLQTQINDWVNSNTDTDSLISSYQDRSQLTDTLIGYSAPISSGQVKNVFIRVEENTEIDYTVLANDQGFRDIMASTAMLENLTSSLDEVTLDPDDPPSTVTAPGADKSEQNENFYRVFNNLASTINGALDRLETVEFQLSQTQAEITQIQENHRLEENVLLENIADVEDVDLNETAVKLNSLGIQLEASFRVTSTLQRLTLTNFI